MKSIKYSIVLLIVSTVMWSCKQTPEPSGPGFAQIVGGIGLERGLIEKKPEHTPGYVYFCPLLSSTTYLINTDGQVVHTWESEYGPSGWGYLMDNGDLLRGGRDPFGKFDGGGQGGYLQRISWEGEILWEYKYSSEDYMTHHDVAVMPNGNILAISWEDISKEEAISAGKNPDHIPNDGIWPDKIVEIKPLENNEAEIVWEWRMWDHMIQNFDPELPNYGNPNDHPELLDINVGGSPPDTVTVEELDERRKRGNANTNDTPDNQGSDIYHLNAINYNPELDQIIFSNPNLGEVFVIDHSTTTEEAAGHSGGRWGKGGDYLYRWGNPQNYGRGDTLDQKLSGQHDVQWIESGKPGAGNILVFNNNEPNVERGFASVLEIDPPLSDLSYEITDNGPFGPDVTSWKYMAADTFSFVSPFISGTHRMANGNTFICQGPKGRFFEVTPKGEIVWEYMTPYSGDSRMPDGTLPQPVGPLIYATFRATHITGDHPAVKERNLEALTPQPEIHKAEENN